MAAKEMKEAAASSSAKSDYKIDDVQELVKCHPQAVPERYIRPKEEIMGPATVLAVSSELHIPVIDMAKLLLCQGPSREYEMAKLFAACKDWGFFQVLNHGIEERTLRRIMEVALEFFKLPLEEKEKYPMKPGTIQGYGHGFIFSEEQKLDWCDMMALGIMPKAIRKENLWPTKPPYFRDTLEAYSREALKLCRTILRLISENLHLKPDFFNDTFGENVQAVRMNYYPPCSRPDLVLGLSAHSDGSALSVLLQDDEPTGLQILNNNRWISVKPIPGVLVVNIGDTLEVLTNGKFKSVEHRAVTNVKKDRLSIVTFHAPSYDVDIGPLPQFIDEDHPRLYRTYKHADYNRHYLSNKLSGKKSLEFAKINPSK